MPLLQCNILLMRNFIFIISLFTYLNVNAQQKSIGGLKKEIDEIRLLKSFSGQDTTYIMLLNKLGVDLKYIKPDTIKMIAQQALDLSKSICFKKGEALSLKTLAEYYIFTGKPDEAIKTAYLSLDVATKENLKDLSIQALNIVAQAYFIKADYPKSYEYFLQAIDIAEELNHSYEIIKMNMNIGTMFTLIEDYEEALLFYEKCLRLYKNYEDQLLYAQIISNIAYTQANIGEYEKAGINTDKSINIFKKIDNKQWLAFSLNTRGTTFLKKNNYPKALLYFKKSKKTHDKLKDKKGRADMFYGLSESYLGLKNLELSEKFAKESLDLYSVMKIKTGMQRCYVTLFKINEAKNKTNEALAYLKISGQLSNVIAKDVNKNNLKMLSAKNQHNKEKEELNQQNARAIAKQSFITKWMLIALLASLVFGVFIFSVNKRVRSLNKKLKYNTIVLESRENRLKKINATQDRLFSIVGHDLKGPIISLKEILKIMINEKNKEVLLQSLLPKLKNETDHIYFTLDNLLSWGKTQMKGIKSNPEEISLKTMIAQTIHLSSEAIGNKHLAVANLIDEKTMLWANKNDIDVVFRNLISNAIKFTNYNGEISISSQSAYNKVIIQIKDNGIGMTPKTQKFIFEENKHYSTFGTNSEKGTGLGLMLCKEMIAKNKGLIKVKSEFNKGTTFFVTLPKNIF